MRHYRVNIFAKDDDGPEIYAASPIDAQDDEAAKVIAEAKYREYEASAIQYESKHTAESFELMEGERLVYSSNQEKSISTARHVVLRRLRRLVNFL